VNGNTLSASDLNTYVQQQTVMVFASAAARTTALASVLAEGMVSYRLDAHVLEVYNGTIWEATETVLTTKGDLVTFDTAPTRLPIGSNTQVLTADSTQATGMKWATPSSGTGNIVQIGSGSLSGTSLSITGLSTYSDIYLFIYNAGYTAITADYFTLTLNGDTTANYQINGVSALGGASGPGWNYFPTTSQTSIATVSQAKGPMSTANGCYSYYHLTNAKSTGYTTVDAQMFYKDNQSGGQYTDKITAIYTANATISSMTFSTTGAKTFSQGTYIIYGG
jgi:hypothetical protein